jgi:HK97 family phage prohead protease
MTMIETAAPVNDLVRALFGPESAELRAAVDEGDGRTLFGHFAVFNKWTEINSMWEGNFMERIAPGAFADTIAERGDRIKVLYDHGQDPSIGNKPLGTIESLSEDAKGAAYEVRLIDTPYNRDFIIPAARANLLGASFRFRVTAEEWDNAPSASKANPAKLPERTITGAEVFEFGPVTFPAYEAASAAVRCGTDRFLDSLLTDPRFVARMVERVGIKTVEQIIADLPARSETTEQADGVPSSPADADATEASAGGQERCDQDIRREWIATHLFPKE